MYTDWVQQIEKNVEHEPELCRGSDALTERCELKACNIGSLSILSSTNFFLRHALLHDATRKHKEHQYGPKFCSQ